MCQVIKIFLTAIFVTVHSKNLPFNKTDVLTTYAKVAYSGSNSNITPPVFYSEGRSNGQSLWTQSSDANIVQGQNLRNTQPKVTYLYSASRPTSKKDDLKSEPVPFKGEVEERFNPRPYFNYEPVAGNKEVHKVSAAEKPLESSDTFPIFAQSESIYGSPYNSYNPPQVKPDTKDNVPTDYDFPPNNNPSVSDMHAEKPPLQAVYDRKPPKASESSETYEAPPPKPYYYKSPYSDVPQDFSQNSGPTKNGFIGPYAYGPPLHSPKDTASKHSKHPDHSDSIYLPPSTDQDDSSNYGPPITMTIKNPSSFDVSYEDSNHKPPDADDLSPPPDDDFDYAHGHSAHYSDHSSYDHGYGFHHEPHVIYHEVHPATTTTTEAPEKRVNTHYSYYYLGRKLWYIPLYFSVYFIVYITVLILKSISRHKITFSQNFVDNRTSRQLQLNDMTENITAAIDKFAM